MAARIVKSWRGRIRAEVKETIKDINSLLAYNLKNPLVGFLSTADQAALLAASAVCQAKLLATKPR